MKDVFNPKVYVAAVAYGLTMGLGFSVLTYYRGKRDAYIEVKDVIKTITDNNESIAKFESQK